MRTPGSAAELERRRQLAIQRFRDGYAPEEIAEFLGVATRSVWRWLAAYQRSGDEGLAARPTPGRPGKLTSTQEKIALRWLSESPTEHGFRTELWSARRLAELIAQHFAVDFHPHYLSGWLRARGYTPQKPLRVPRERDPEAIAQWCARQWPRIKKRSAAGKRTCC